MVMTECIRPFAHAPLHLELVFNLLARSAMRCWCRLAPNGGFLTRSNGLRRWKPTAFGRAVYPDIAAIRDAYPSCVIGRSWPGAREDSARDTRI